MDKLRGLVYTAYNAAIEIEVSDVNNWHLADSPAERPLFSIGAVTEITGIQEATLRVWERRYHFPHTTRTHGGHRVYSQDEVLHLQWVKMLLDDGMRTGAAIQALHQTARNAAVVAALHETLQTDLAPTPELVAVRPALLDALLRYDADRATIILHEAVESQSVRSVVLEVIGPTLAAIGECWSAGEAAVATEHFASNLLRDQLFQWMRVSPRQYSVRPAILACAPEELHEGSLLMLGVLLRGARWPVMYLGQSLPLPDLAALVDRTNPALIVFVAMSETSALALADWPHWLTRPNEGELPIIGYGGRAFTENQALAERVPGVLLGATLSEGFRRIHRVMLNHNALQN